jgi:hypothetical protein
MAWHYVLSFRPFLKLLKYVCFAVSSHWWMKQEYRDKTTDLTLIKKNDCIVFKEFTGVKSPIDACNSSNKILFLNFSFLRTLTCLKDAFTMLSTWFVQFPSDAKVNPKYLWFFTISKSAQRNKVVEFKMHINYVLSTCVIVYLLQYLVPVIIIQHQEVDSECLWYPVYHPLFRYGTIEI